MKNKPKVGKDGKNLPVSPKDANKGKWEKRTKTADQIKKAITRLTASIKKQETDAELKVRWRRP